MINLDQSGPVPLSRLRSLIGRSLEIRGQQCRVMDVLEDGPMLVLEVIGATSIQADQWGDAHRRTPESFALSVYEEDGGDLNPLLDALLESAD